jgi:hypothetical protein
MFVPYLTGVLLIFCRSEWKHFGSDEPCPYHFSEDQLRRHREEVESFNKSQEFWKGLQGILTDEGYTSNESFDRAVERLKGLRDLGLAGLKGEERQDFDKETHWVTDLDDRDR